MLAQMISYTVEPSSSFVWYLVYVKPSGSLPSKQSHVLALVGTIFICTLPVLMNPTQLNSTQLNRGALPPLGV